MGRAQRVRPAASTAAVSGALDLIPQWGRPHSRARHGERPGSFRGSYRLHATKGFHGNKGDPSGSGERSVGTGGGRPPPVTRWCPAMGIPTAILDPQLPFDLYSHPSDPEIVPASQPANVVNAATLPRTFYSLAQIHLSKDTHLCT